MKKSFKSYVVYLLVLLVIFGGVSFFLNGMNKLEVKYSDIVSYFKTEQVKEFEVKSNNKIELVLQDGKKLEYRLASLNLFYSDMGELIAEQHEAGIIEVYDYVAASDNTLWLTIVPYLILALIMGVAFYFMFARMNGEGGKAASFVRSRVKPADDKNKKTFDDVAGADEEKEELVEIVDFLKNPRKYVEIGARIPKGILLYGPPGTGKTLLAKAVAGEAGVPFLSISGSDFVEMYVGVGASRVRDLFEQAKKNLPSIVFIDEIDAVGRHRGAGLGGGHDEREQTLNQLLVEMDGFGVNEGIIVIAATNRPDILDPALLRPGRFDRQIMVSPPDAVGREAILKVHAKGKPFADDVSLETIAKSTVGMTGADLENILNEAALLAARHGKAKITMSDIEEATSKVIMGPEKKSRKVTERENKMVAYHEAGHAIVTRMMPLLDKVHEISIIPRGRAGGYTMFLPKEDKNYATKCELEQEIASLLGGRAAEYIVLEDVGTGASNDLERATKLARSMVMKYGMSDELGPIVYATAHNDVFLGRDINNGNAYSEKVAAQIDEQVKLLVEGQFKRAVEILTENREKLDELAALLLEKEKVNAEQFEELFSGKPEVKEEAEKAAEETEQ